MSGSGRVGLKLFTVGSGRVEFLTNEESNSAANINGRKFLYNSKGLDVISLLIKYYVPLVHFNKVINL